MTGRRDEQIPGDLIVAGEFSELPRIAEWVRAWSAGHRLPERVAGRLDLCAAEIVTNVVTYGLADDRDQHVALSLRRADGEVVLEIEDDGIPFDPLQVEEPEPPTSLEGARIGGLGIHLVRKLSDGLRHRRSEGRNRLTLIFRLPPP